MPRTCREDELLSKAKKIQRLDTEEYLTFRQELSEKIPDFIKTMADYAKEGSEITTSQYNSAKYFFKFWIEELKDPKSVMAGIEHLLYKQREEKYGEKPEQSEKPVEEEQVEEESLQTSVVSFKR